MLELDQWLRGIKETELCLLKINQDILSSLVSPADNNGLFFLTHLTWKYFYKKGVGFGVWSNHNESTRDHTWTKPKYILLDGLKDALATRHDIKKSTSLPRQTRTPSLPPLFSSFLFYPAPFSRRLKIVCQNVFCILFSFPFLPWQCKSGAFLLHFFSTHLLPVLFFTEMGLECMFECEGYPLSHTHTHTHTHTDAF